MRQSLRDAPPGRKRAILSPLTTVLQTVMEQIKSDLRVVALDPAEHPSYVTFVRDIISIIRSHCTEICSVDEFFYQINKEYSPSLQDPGLHVAGIIAYGLRLGEGEAKVAPQLFYYLYNNFKVALINDKLDNEARMLRRGMVNDHVLGFVLRSIVPSVAMAAVETRGVFPLLDVYRDALVRLFKGSVAGHELSEELLPDVLSLVRAIVRCLSELGNGDNATPSAEQLHVARQMCSIVNTLWPSLEAFAYMRHPSESICALEVTFGRLQGWLDSAISCLDNALERRETPGRNEIFGGLQATTLSASGPASQATTFKEPIVADVRKNWLISDRAITIQAPAKPRRPSSTQSGQGIKTPGWDVLELVELLSEELKIWRFRQGEVFQTKHGEGGGKGKRVRSITNALLF